MLGQLGWSYDDGNYLPLAAGMLAATCRANPDFSSRYELDPWLRFARAEPAAIVAGMAAPDGAGPSVLGLSAYVWCERLSLDVARLAKARWPGCLIVLGGPSVTDHHYGERLLRAHPYVDVLVHGEGEQTFLEVCLAADEWQEHRSRVAGIAYLSDGRYTQTNSRPREARLERFPSPFLDGTFDRLLETPAGKGASFAGLIEPDRGCPFACSFCFLGVCSRRQDSHLPDGPRQGGIGLACRPQGGVRIRSERELRAALQS